MRPLAGPSPINLSACKSLCSLTLIISDGEKDWLRIWPTIATLSGKTNICLEDIALSIRPFGHECVDNAELWTLIPQGTALHTYTALRELRNSHRFKRFTVVRDNGRDVDDQVFPHILERCLPRAPES